MRPRPRRVWISAVGASVLLGLFVPSALATYSQPNAEQRASSTGEELVVNGGFEDRAEGWRSNDAEAQPLAWSDVAATGEVSAYLTPAATQTTVIVNDRVNTVGSTTAGETYTVSARVRSTDPTLFGQLRVRETQNGRLVNRDMFTFGASDGEWTDVELSYVSQTSGGSLDLNVLAWRVPVGQGLLVDDVSMIRTADGDGSTDPAPTTAPTTTTPAPTTTNPPTTTEPTTTTPAPTTTEPTTTTPAPTTNPPTTTPAPTTTAPAPPPAPRPPAGSCVSDPRGLPAPSQGAYLGATVSGTSDLGSLESQLGSALPLHRTYYGPDGLASAVAQANADHALNRMPWISFKVPYNWTDMANGRGDAWVLQAAQSMAAVDGPVWLAFHHEPEGDGDIREWTRMQAHLSPLVRGNASNVAYSIIFTGWNQFWGPTQYSLANTWPGDGNVDIIGIDPYNWFGQNKDGRTVSNWSEMAEYYSQLAPFAAAHGARWAVAESGYTDEAAARDPGWLARAVGDLARLGGIGFAYFDTSYNNLGGSWQLSPPKIAAFRALLPQSARLC